jgi:hypothetical protein
MENKIESLRYTSHGVLSQKHEMPNNPKPFLSFVNPTRRSAAA